MSLFRFARNSQPQSPTGIDWGNPITRGLVVATTNGSTKNIVSGSGTFNEAYARVASPKGVYVNRQGVVLSADSRLNVDNTKGVSIVTAFRIGTFNSGGIRCLFATGAPGSSNLGIAFNSAHTNAAYAGAFYQGSSYSIIGKPTGGALANSTEYQIAVSSANGTGSVYYNGLKTGTASGLTAPLAGANMLGMGSDSDGGSPNDVNFLYYFQFNRALSDLEIKSLSDNPWQIFQPTNRAIYPAAASVTYTLTADAASYSISGADASLIANRKLPADTANIPIAGADATLTHTPIGGPTYTLTADAGSIAVNGNAATLAFNRVLTADAGSYSVAGQAVGLAFNRVLSASTTNIPVAGQDVTLTYTNNGFTYTLSAEAGAVSVTGQDARLVWSGEQTGFTNEVVLKPWYIRRNKKILLFGTAQEADAYIEAEEVAEQAIQEAQKTSRRARKRLRDKLITIEPIQTVDVDQLAEAVQRFSIPVDLPKLIAQQDYESVMQILALAAEMQDEEDVEMLLLM